MLRGWPEVPQHRSARLKRGVARPRSGHESGTRRSSPRSHRGTARAAARPHAAPSSPQRPAAIPSAPLSDPPPPSAAIFPHRPRPPGPRSRPPSPRALLRAAPTGSQLQAAVPPAAPQRPLPALQDVVVLGLEQLHPRTAAAAALLHRPRGWGAEEEARSRAGQARRPSQNPAGRDAYRSGSGRFLRRPRARVPAQCRTWPCPATPPRALKAAARLPPAVGFRALSLLVAPLSAAGAARDAAPWRAVGRRFAFSGAVFSTPTPNGSNLWSWENSEWGTLSGRARYDPWGPPLRAGVSVCTRWQTLRAETPSPGAVSFS